METRLLFGASAYPGPARGAEGKFSRAAAAEWLANYGDQLFHSGPATGGFFRHRCPWPSSPEEAQMECEIRSRAFEWYEDIMALFTNEVAHIEAVASRPDPNLGGIARGAARFLLAGERPALWATCQSAVPCFVDSTVHRERARALRHPGVYKRRRAGAVVRAVQDFIEGVAQRVWEVVDARREERAIARPYPPEAGRLAPAVPPAAPWWVEGPQPPFVSRIAGLGRGELHRQIASNPSAIMALVAQVLDRRGHEAPPQSLSAVEPDPEKSAQGSIHGSVADSDSGPECEPGEGGDAGAWGADSGVEVA